MPVADPYAWIMESICLSCDVAEYGPSKTWEVLDSESRPLSFEVFMLSCVEPAPPTLEPTESVLPGCFR
jgi:hypothetical protein